MRSLLALSVPLVFIAAPACADEGEHRRSEPNRLIDEKSVYLQQHAYNPVDWYPWGDEAFEKAREEDKPIFLSIGYSTCHWCHVMERESFEDEEIAAYLNEHFVSVKVDREERPDVDSIYMNYVTGVRGSGGWPLTAFLTPSRIPFFGATYFPPRRKGRSPGFLDVIQMIDAQWKDNRDALLANNERVLELLEARTEVFGDSGEIDDALFDAAYKDYAEAFDFQFGGSRGAPKFPAPMMMSYLLRYESLTGERRALELVEKTLISMADGGIHDLLGGGFARYSVDARWLVPHFEKMLYTQGLLARVYAEAWQRTKNPRFEEVARGILDYVLRDMRVEGGMFAAAEDADSEGEEGLFYTWTPAEMRAALGDEFGEVAIRLFGATEKGHLDGRSVLHRAAFDDVDPRVVADISKKLFDARAVRERPLRDDKVVTAWNGLMISAFAFCGRVFREPRYVAAAQEAASSVLDKLHADGRLIRRYRAGEARGDGFLDDYAFFSQALLDLYEADFDGRWLLTGAALTDKAVELFGDDDGVTFYDTAEGGEALLVRPRDGADGALPAGPAVLCKNLVRLSDWMIDEERKERALACLNAYADSMRRAPQGFTEMLNAALWALEPPREVVFAGEAGSDGVAALVDAYYQDFHPHRVLALAPADDAERDRLAARFGVIRDKTMIDGKAAAYVCENYTCHAPVTDPALLSLGW